jgi:RNA polymerase sigma-70 factor (ECF subfamily)
VDVEDRFRSLVEAGDLRAAASAAVEGYGPEVLGFLVTLLRSEADAAEAFAQACEDLWTGLPRFEGRSSLRTWFYVLARHAASRLRRSPHQRHRRAAVSEVSLVAEGVRSRTLPFLRTEVKDRFAAIRDALPEEDRALLVLRVDRNMSWNEIARVLLTRDSSDEPSREILAREAARLRKRFQLVKDDIRARAREVGLISEDDA